MVGNVPDWLLPEATADATEADVVVVGAQAGRATEQARSVAERLHDGGIAIALGSFTARRALAAQLAGHGIRSHARAWARRRGGTNDAASITLGVGDSPAVAARLRAELVQVTILRRERTQPLASWLPGSEPILRIETSWRGPDGSAVVSRREGDGSAGLFAKVGLGTDTADVGMREAEALRRLTDAATEAGARVPEVRGVTEVAGRPAALLSALAGRPVAGAARRSVRAAGTDVIEWLQRFTRATLTTAPTDAVVDRFVLAPAASVAPAIDGAAYVEHLGQLANGLGGDRVDVSAAHRDLTLWNVLDGERLGIVDWETATGESPPLLDLPYLLVDARCWSSYRRDRVAAFRACYPDARMRIEPDVAAASGMSPDSPMLELSFHACWLGHAANELRRGRAGPFVEIVREVAASVAS